MPRHVTPPNAPSGSSSDATPLLVRLAKSSNPVARGFAAWGFAEIQSDVGRTVLQVLAQDHAYVMTQRGCEGHHSSVAQLASDALARYP